MAKKAHVAPQMAEQSRPARGFQFALSATLMPFWKAGNLGATLCPVRTEAMAEHAGPRSGWAWMDFRGLSVGGLQGPWTNIVGPPLRG